MELWIRSQCKTTLIRSYEIYIAEYSKDIYVVRAKRTSHILGAYKTMERALEVLDEIQNILKPKYILDSSSIKPNEYSWVENDIIISNYTANVKIEELSTYVYEMPSE